MSMMRAVAYARYSSDEQRQESITAQLRAIKYYAANRGYELVGVYTDEARSGRTDKRPQFLRMVEDSGRDAFDAVLVHKFDRFSRSAEDTMYYERTLRLNGVNVVSVLEDLDSTPEGLLMKQIILGMNQFYSANLAREVMKGLKENAYRCRHTGGIPPLGYDVAADKSYIVNEREAQAVRMIFEMHAAGKGYSEIISVLNAAGYKTKAGKSFGKNSLYEILKNEKYAGVYVYNRSAPSGPGGKFNRHKYKPTDEIIRIDGGIPAIVDKNLFEAVRQKMEANKKDFARYKARQTYMLSGKLFCGECGHAMSGETARYRDKEYSYYSCSYFRTTKNCASHRVSKDLVEQGVLQDLNDMLFNNRSIDSICQHIYDSCKDGGANEKAASLRREAASIQRKVDNLYKAIESGLDATDAARRINEHLQEKERLMLSAFELESVPEAEKKTASEIKAAFTRTASILALSPEGQKTFLQKFVEKVFLYEDNDGFSVRILINPNKASVSDFLNAVGGEGGI